jgi:homoserine/homoserine lactone efflux protein
MDISTWLTYLAVALICAITPGPGVLFAISNSIKFGWKRTTFSAFGNITGLLLVSSFTMTGLGALLNTSVVLFSLLKIIGGSYLIYLGLRQWRSKTNAFSEVKENTSDNQQHKTNAQLFFKGMLVALTNPKAVLFFSALFPQFIKIEKALIPQFIILTTTFMLGSFISLIGYAYTATSAKTWFSSPRRINGFNKTTGGIFIVLGASLFRLQNKQH